MRNRSVQHFVDVDGARLNVWEWRGEGDPVVLLHATGFHSRCWDYVAEQLPEQHIYAVDLRFHGESSKEGKVDWPTMADDIKGVLEKLDIKNAVLSGHSIGGYLATVTAADMPERVKELVLLDPVIMSRTMYKILRLANGFMKPEKHPVSRRRTEWDSSESMYQRYKKRAPFKYWEDRALKDYCAHALFGPDEKGVHKLACSPLHEVQIYLNHNGKVIHNALGRVKAPATILRARTAGLFGNPLSFSVSPTWSKLSGAFQIGRDVHLTDLSHFIPMEAPDVVVNYIKEAIEGYWHR
ncbi:alpha/beta fold hydrolase [Kordiimonas laminariae]|uniref:alpha/beta fold hydrolase n=1 Tax=Kordiimonas laminariae TaxID=2917717 RepID=UPI001FF4FE2E|nr:alpha/beta hydrolase [Kordiimonas laminariae]MCK0070579.1 alpha/beta hydrolase [Kordiimonas laminariae]